MKHLAPLIHRPLFDDPLYSQKNPHQTFLLIFCLYSSVPLMMGDSSGSGVLDANLDSTNVFFWGCCLFFGSVLALIGEFWAGRTYTALVLERTGIALVGIGALLYSIVIVVATELDETRYVVGITTAYGISSLWRVVQITRRLRWLRGLMKEVCTDEQ